MLRSGRGTRVLGLFLACALASSIPAGPGPLAAKPPKPVPTRHGRYASLEGYIFLRVPLVRRGDLTRAARTYTGSTKNAARLGRFNRRVKRRGQLEARIPLSMLLPVYRRETLSALFPRDRRTSSGWEHVWGSSPLGKREAWTDVARWFTGSSKYANTLLSSNKRAGRRPKAGTKILVPTGLLLKAIRSMKAPAPPPGPGLPGGQKEGARTKPYAKGPIHHAGKGAGKGKASSPSAPVPLTYGRDGKGGYAVYKLRSGEALYSAVVVRFTGNVNAEEVNALALQVAKRSGIKDVTDIPVGFPVKIALDDLLPQYLPKDDARYIAWAKDRAEMSAVTNTYKSSVLEGVVVILDPGHGGLDRGAMKHGVWEDSYVYDIACRIHEGLERRTKARVLMTLLVPGLGYRPQARKKLDPNTSAVILTHPWFRQRSKAETRMEVNLRWYLANQYYMRLKKEGVDPQRVVFTSIHADSLHPSLRGSMFYVPGDAYRPRRWCVSGKRYRTYREYRAKPCYEMSRRTMRRSEGLSYQLTNRLEEVFARHKLAIHPYNPTRDHVVRGRRKWVPAVLRNSIIPCSILVEVCNLNNRKDAVLIADPDFRQAVAEAYIDALIEYYS